MIRACCAPWLVWGKLHQVWYVCLQTQQHLPNVKSKGTFDAMRSIVKADGIAGLYRGFGANALSLIAGQVYITTLEFLKGLQPADRPESVRTLFAAAAAGMCSQVVANPIDVVSQTIMAGSGAAAPAASEPKAAGRASASSTTPSSAQNQRGAIGRVLRSVLAKDGVRGLYRGYWASIAQNVPSSGIWWTAYGLIRNTGYGLVPKDAPQERRAWLQRAVETLSGFSAGACTAVLGCPLDVVRVRVQVRGTAVGETVKSLLAQEGIGGFWKGVGARFWMLAPNGAVIISAYELVKRLALRDELREEFNTPNPMSWA